jgi:glycosyltransferase involved in cell wall biosynthesis
MNILFVHQNFPGQFVHVAPALAARGHRVVALGVETGRPSLPRVQHILHVPDPAQPDLQAPAGHLREWAAKLARGRSCAQAMERLRAEGFVPDVVFAHPGWGEALHVKDVFPACRLLIYGEYFYGETGGDTGFDPEFAGPSGWPGNSRLRLKNTHLLHALATADQALSPTRFQKSRHPEWFQPRIEVIHDGIETERFVPEPRQSVKLAQAGITFRAGDEVVTFVARQLEPYRGYHTFMRALPLLQRLRPQAHVVIVGGNSVAYGAAAPAGRTWRQIFLDEVREQVDLKRIHFVGTVPHAVLTQLLQVSAVHTYLTYPFVLSWSVLEALSIGCLVVGSRTAPVEEVIEDGRNGFLVDFFDADALARRVAEILERRGALTHVRMAARQTALEYDLSTRCLPGWIRFVEG